MDTDELINAAVASMKKHINEVVDYAINMYASTQHNKNHVISVVVSQFIGSQLSQLHPDFNFDDPQFTHETDRIDINVVLQSLGETGIRMGALAYVVAIRLEALLPEDHSITQDVAFVEPIGQNEYKLVGMAPSTPDFRLSNCYKRYIDQDPFVAEVFLNHGY